MPNLQHLDLRGTAVGDAGLEALAPLHNLQTLGLYGTAVTDAGLPALQRLSGLRRLYVGGTKVTPPGLAALRQAGRTARHAMSLAPRHRVDYPSQHAMRGSRVLLLASVLPVALVAAAAAPFVSWRTAAPTPAPAAAPGPALPDTISFNQHIRPILVANCFRCHGSDPGTREAELRLDRPEFAFAPRANGQPVIVKGDPGRSALVRRITSSDPETVMPPPETHKTLAPRDIALLERWIKEGATYEPHWAFIKPERPALPDVRQSGLVSNPIDRFVLARLEAEGLTPNPEADRHTLIRRVTLDLTGLAPTPAEIDAFVRDTSPKAYETLVDRLLARPSYGEHRARYWLDAVRYADTHGYHFDNYRSIWPYRDWVIDAFNANQPFDRFTQEQIAGDLLPKATPNQLIATGYIRAGMSTNEGGTIPEENLATYATDRVETTSQVWLGLTIGCARCHDHKFDPISAKDFYSMAAFFRNTTQPAMDGNVMDSPPVLRIPRTEDAARYAALPGEIDDAIEDYDVPSRRRRARFRELAADSGSQGPADDLGRTARIPAPLRSSRPHHPAQRGRSGPADHVHRRETAGRELHPSVRRFACRRASPPIWARSATSKPTSRSRSAPGCR